MDIASVMFPNVEEGETRTQKVKRECIIHDDGSYLYRFIKIQQHIVIMAIYNSLITQRLIKPSDIRLGNGFDNR